MKNLFSLGQILNKVEQQQINGGGLQGPPEDCLTNEDCMYLHGDVNARCNARTGRCYIFN